MGNVWTKLNTIKKIKRIALIYPVKSFMPPLGLITIASILKNKNIEVIVISLFDYEYKTEKNFSQKALDQLNNFKPDLIGIGFMSAEWDAAKKIIETIKNTYSDQIIVAGGRHPTCFPEEVIKWGADFVVLGEGETGFVELIDFINNKNELYEFEDKFKELEGLSFIDKNNILHYKKRQKETADLDVIPAYDLIPYQKFINARLGLVGRYLKSGWLATSRGCFSKCIYCRDENFGSSLRYRSMASIFEDIRYQLKNYDLNCFYIIDDMFAVNETRVLEFCAGFKEIQKEFKKKLYFACTTRTDTLTEKMVNAMKESGCTQVSIGVESGSQKIHDFLRTKKQVKTVIPAFELLKKSGIDTFVNFIVGIPGEEEEDFKMSLDLLNKIKPNTIGVSFLTPYPGTPFYSMSLENNWIDNGNFSNIIYKHSYDEPQLNIDIDHKVIIDRKKQIYNKSSKITFLNIFKHYESIELLIDMIKITLNYPIRMIKILTNLLSGNIDLFKEEYRFLLYLNAKLNL